MRIANPLPPCESQIHSALQHLRTSIATQRDPFASRNLASPLGLTRSTMHSNLVSIRLDLPGAHSCELRTHTHPANPESTPLCNTFRTLIATQRDPFTSRNLASPLGLTHSTMHSNLASIRLDLPGAHSCELRTHTHPANPESTPLCNTFACQLPHNAIHSHHEIWPAHSD
jgi:hypothetical protein